MKKMIVFAILLGGIIACSGGNDKSKSNSKSATAIDGAKIYKSNCMLCHGDDGKLGLNNSKDLTVSKLTKEERIDIITNGKNTMVGFSSLLDEDEIKAVAEYTFTLK
ncbi:MAG: cytochrome c [Saprospiraceae bacterium]|nr:cytochrome c [Saprospiraceae bacterium]